MAYTTIDDPSAHHQTKIYTGNGSSNNAITFDGNSNLQPDWVWNKSRSIADSHALFDSTRGLNKLLYSNVNLAEGTDTNGNIESFDSNGITVGGNQEYANKSGSNQVTWAWKANGGTRTTNSESGNNPGGGYQANTTAGFSIVDYTGTGSAGTMAHGLGAVPHWIIVKRRDSASSWIVYHHKNTDAPETDILELQATNATYDNSTYWNDTAPTSSVFTINTSSDGNADAGTYIAYCFTEIKGYSKFGRYIGSGETNGPFVYLGFKPAWLMIKPASLTGYWVMIDNKRNTPNGTGKRLGAQATDAEYGSTNVDLLSNGFKVRASSSDSDTNNSGSSYVYMAFAEHPFVSSEGVPTTAR